MPHGGGTTILTSKLENLRTLGPNEEVERISLVRVLTGYLAKLKEVNESTQFTCP